MPTTEERLLELIGDVQGLPELEEFRRGLIDALGRAVPSDWVSINEVGPQPGDYWGVVEPELPDASREVFARLMHQNPLVAYMTDGARRGGATRLSDVTSAADYHRLDIYRELYGPLGVRTVDKHLQNAFVKLGVTSRSQAAARAWELALRSG